MSEREIDVIDWKLIGSCNLRCGHCYGPPKSEKALSLPTLKQVIGTLAELQPEWVVLTGGEPLLVHGIDRVMGDLTDIGTKVALATNTTLFRRYQKAIEQNVSSLNIPLDGSTSEIHAISRGGDTSTYHAFFDVLEHYRANPEDKPELLRVGTVFSAATRGDLIPMARRLEEFVEVIDRWKIYEMMDYDVQRDLREPLMRNGGEFEQETSELLAELNGSPLTLKIMLSPSKARDKAYFMINPRGVVVMPTNIDGVSYEIPIGHILDDPLPEIVARWRGEIEPANYHDNHKHYEKNGQNISLRVFAA